MNCIGAHYRQYSNTGPDVSVIVHNIIFEYRYKRIIIVIVSAYTMKNVRAV